MWLSETERTAVVSLVGDYEHSVAGQLREVLLEACTKAQELVLIDLAGAKFLDTTVIGVMVAAYGRCKSAGKSLHLVNASGSVLSTLTILGLHDLMPADGRTSDNALRLTALRRPLA